MVQYRRSQTTGGTFFFTVNLRDRSSGYLVTHVDCLRESVRVAKQQFPFEIVAFVVLPEHLHAIFRLPENDNDYPARWRAIKSHFSRALIRDGVGLKKNLRGEINLWQRRYWEHQIRDDADLQAHVDYIHFNPVKHGYVDRVSDWPYSSFHRYVQSGILENAWGDSVLDGEGGRFGE